VDEDIFAPILRLDEAEALLGTPSMIPRKSGDRQKTDKRDAASLAVLHRGGLLTAVWVGAGCGTLKPFNCAAGHDVLQVHFYVKRPGVRLLPNPTRQHHRSGGPSAKLRRGSRTVRRNPRCLGDRISA
jgi:hypothetical protein